jgi:hypothetical protein
MTNGKRDYKRENEKYNSRPENVRTRVERNKARRAMIRAGKAAKGDGKDVDHKTPLSHGGTSSLGNLRSVSRSTNRSFARRRNGSLLNQISRKGQ